MNASTKRFTLPDRNVLAGGIASVAALLVVAGLRIIGYDVPLDYALMVVAIIGPTISYFVPPTIKDFFARFDAVLREAAASPATSPTQEVIEAGEKVKTAISQANRFEKLS